MTRMQKNGNLGGEQARSQDFVLGGAWIFSIIFKNAVLKVFKLFKNLKLFDITGSINWSKINKVGS